MIDAILLVGHIIALVGAMYYGYSIGYDDGFDEGFKQGERLGEFTKWWR